MQDTGVELLLFEALREGDEKALEMVFLRYYRILCRYSTQLLRDETQAQEVVADVFWILWEKRQTIQLRQSLRSYLYTMTRNHSLRRLKASNRLPQHVELTETTIDQYDSELSLTTGPENIPSLSVAHLAACIDQLPEQRRKIFRLNKLEGLSYSEIAGQLGLSEKTVKNQVFRAMQQLKHASLVLFLLYSRLP